VMSHCTRPPHCSPLCPPHPLNQIRSILIADETRQPVRAASTSPSLLSLEMHAQASQAMHMAPVSSAGDAIPSGAALALSSIAVAAAIGQICGCFLPSVLRRWQLAICCIFFASSASLFGVVFSRFHGTRNFSAFWYSS